MNETNSIKLGKAEEFVLEYLYKKEAKEISYTTHKELLNAYNGKNKSNIKSINSTLTILRNKEFICKDYIDNRNVYWISYKGISIIARF